MLPPGFPWVPKKNSQFGSAVLPAIANKYIYKYSILIFFFSFKGVIGNALVDELSMQYCRKSF